MNGKRHREDGPACEWASGDKYWYLNGKHHREDGPAIECTDGDKIWYLNGKLHRENGPAIERINGNKSWWLNGEYFTTKFKWEYEVNKLKSTCSGKVVEIDGKKYKLMEV